MTQQEALHIFHKVIKGANSAAGICHYLVPGALHSDEIKHIPTPNGFNLELYYKGDLIREEKRFGSTYRDYEKKKFTSKFEFGEFKKMRVHHNTQTCKNAKGDHQMDVFISMNKFFSIDLMHEDLDHFIAAFLILAPESDIIAGLGL